MVQRKELTTVLINVITAKMVLMVPKLFIENSANAAWLQLTVNCVFVFFLYWIIFHVYRGRKNIIALAEMAGGKPLKIITGVIVFSFLMVNYSSIVMAFPDTVKIVLLQDFNIKAIVIVFEIIIAIGAYVGIEALSKVTYIYMPFMGAVLTVFLIFLIPYYHFYNILPIFGNGYLKLFLKGFNSISIFSDMLILNILMPYYSNAMESKKSGMRAIMISSAVIISIMTVYCLVVPYPVSEDFTLPVYQLARMVHLGSFFSRFEAVFEFAWSILMLMYSSIYVFVMCYVWQITFNLKYYRPLIFPVIFISVWAESLLDENVVNIIYPVAFVIPLIFAFVSTKFVRRDGGMTSEKA